MKIIIKRGRINKHLVQAKGVLPFFFSFFEYVHMTLLGGEIDSEDYNYDSVSYLSIFLHHFSQIVNALKERGYPAMKKGSPFLVYTISDFQTVDYAMVRHLWESIFNKNDFLNLNTEKMKVLM